MSRSEPSPTGSVTGRRDPLGKAGADIAIAVAVALQLHWPELIGFPATAGDTEPAPRRDVWVHGGRTWSRPGLHQ